MPTYEVLQVIRRSDGPVCTDRNGEHYCWVELNRAPSDVEMASLADHLTPVPDAAPTEFYLWLERA